MPRFIFALWLAIATGCAGLDPVAPLRLRVVAFNDFHGHLETPPQGVRAAGRGTIPAGGAAHLATAIRDLRAGHANTIVVAAGDLVSASPLASSLFLDEPTVIALSEAGLEISSVGNHDFDRGRAELERLQRGGCSVPESCFEGRFPGARFQYLAANVIDAASGKAVFPAYVVRRFEGVPVAFMGAVLRGTRRIVRASGIAGLEFRDEAASVNALVPELRAQGVEAMVLLIHEGGRSSGAYDDPACPDFEGAIVNIVKRLDPAIDVVVSGHTHEAYICRVNGRLVTSAGSYGRFLTAIDILLDPQSRDVVEARAANVVVDTRKYRAEARIEAYVERVVALAAGRSGRVVATVEGTFTQGANLAGESSVGNLVADSQLAAMRGAGAEVAFMNPGGIRAPLVSRRPDKSITFGDLHAVEPFGNTLVAMTLTGAQLAQLLEQQSYRLGTSQRPHLLAMSEGSSYAWDASRPAGRRVIRDTIRIAGRAFDENARYRVVVNDFLSTGGDGFNVLTHGSDVVGGPTDLEALEDYVRGRALVARPPEGRITRR